MTAPRSHTPDTLVVTYLEMTERAQFRPAFVQADGFRILPLAAPEVEFYRSLYRAVGAQWRWRDRLIMPDAELQAALAQPGTTVYVLYDGADPAGYVELVREGQEVEIAYFGLFPAYLGRGLGKHLLSYGIERAWAGATARVWLHTCNLDGPYALENYVKRGFRIYKVEHSPMPERYKTDL